MPLLMNIEDYDDPPVELEDVPEVTLIEWKDFMKNPFKMFQFFEKIPNELKYDESKIWMYELEKKPRTESMVWNIESPEQLEKIAHDLHTKPMFTKVEMHHLFEEKGKEVQAVYACLYNTTLPHIDKKLQKRLKKCIEIMKKGQLFCLEISWTKAINNWYCDKTGFGKSLWGKILGGRLILTNAERKKHRYDCNMSWATLLCLCWLAVAPCYLCSRAKITDMFLNLKDEIVELKGDVPSEPETEDIEEEDAAAENNVNKT